MNKLKGKTQFARPLKMNKKTRANTVMIVDK